MGPIITSNNLFMYDSKLAVLRYENVFAMHNIICVHRRDCDVK